MSQTTHCCKSMTEFLKDPAMPLRYLSNTREYGIILRGPSAIQVLDYCLWCDKRLPPSLRKTLYETIKKEHGIEDYFHISDDPNIPEEFKSDEWWKKRDL